MNSVRKYEGCRQRKSIITKLIERVMYGRQTAPVLKELHTISYRPAVYPQGWKGGNV